MSADSRPHHRLRGYEGQFRVDPPGNGGKVWYRRFSRVRVFAGEGLLAEPIAGPQLQWRELVFVPHSSRSRLRSSSARLPNLDRCPCRHRT